MASGDCECCGQPTTVPGNGLVAIERECDHGCFDCTNCNACDYGDCSGTEHVPAVVLCDDCVEDGDGCGPGAWHCDGRAGHSCDGTACARNTWSDFAHAPFERLRSTATAAPAARTVRRTRDLP